MILIGGGEADFGGVDLGDVGGEERGGRGGAAVWVGDELAGDGARCDALLLLLLLLLLLGVEDESEGLAVAAALWAASRAACLIMARTD